MERRLFRMMQAHEGQPTVGRSGSKLGVRPSVAGDDIPDESVVDLVVVESVVHAQSPSGEWQGMSVQLDPRDLQPHRRPPEIEDRRGNPGKGKRPLFELSEAAIPASLELKVTSGTHAVLVARSPMSLTEYERAIEETLPNWSITDVEEFRRVRRGS